MDSVMDIAANPQIPHDIHMVAIGFILGLVSFGIAITMRELKSKDD